ncbi:MAG TPA: PAS domain-containing sensor histidine kinase [Ignavibacteriaceae bacterium]|nr:PAS domain-containing sensor histidine kinase [Ignavibacteriaceae bacterium]
MKAYKKNSVKNISKKAKAKNKPVKSAIKKIQKKDKQVKSVNKIPNSKKLSPGKIEDVQKLIELLKIHQIELEHQNQELRNTQQELEESRNKYVNLFDFSPIPYFTLDSNGSIKEVNLSASKMFGIDRNKLMGKNLITYIYPDDRVIFGSFIKSLFYSPDKQSCELKIVSKDKHLFRVLLEGLMLDDITEPGSKCQIALIDLTEYKKIEYDLNKANEELKKLNANKDKFFSIIAHDLSSPFQGLLGITETLVEESRLLTPDESKELYNSAYRLFKLLSNLLEWAQMNKGEVNYMPVDLKLSSIVSQNIEFIKPKAISKEIRINTDIPDSTEIYADVNMINSILRNLLSNAVKFTPLHGEILLSVKEVGKMLEISVSDTGVGISEEDIKRLFKIDEKVSSEGTEGEPSAGLGLILCKEFVEKHGGHIWVESKVGKGSKFILTLHKSN